MLRSGFRIAGFVSSHSLQEHYEQERDSHGCGDYGSWTGFCSLWNLFFSPGNLPTHSFLPLTYSLSHVSFFHSPPPIRFFSSLSILPPLCFFPTLYYAFCSLFPPLIFSLLFLSFFFLPPSFLFFSPTFCFLSLLAPSSPLKHGEGFMLCGDTMSPTIFFFSYFLYFIFFDFFFDFFDFCDFFLYSLLTFFFFYFFYFFWFFF